MTGRILVGYTATKGGRDALALGARIAAATGAVLELVIVLPDDERSRLIPSDHGYERYLRDQAQQWLEEAGRLVPVGIVSRGHVRIADSFAEGLAAAAGQLRAALVVVGSARGGARGTHLLGSTASELVHSADTPVVLAPRNERKREVHRIPRITVALGARPGGEALLQVASDLAAACGAEVRLLSLITVDLPADIDTGVVRVAAAAHADSLLADVRASLPPGIAAEVVTARGEHVSDALDVLPWLPGELLLVGSSRLAQPGRLFLGSTAAKMLREVPVPMVVVPRTLRADAARIEPAARPADEAAS